MLKSKQSIFSFKELLLLNANNSSVKSLKAKINYYVKEGYLYHIRRGLYAKDKNYNRLELATKIFSPSYISFETVLNKEGVVFQYYSQIFVASYQSREIICDNQTYVFKQIKPTVLTNSQGIIKENNYYIASSERAFLDILYLNKNYYFDNLRPMNWDKIYEILPIYGNNKSLKKRIDKYYEYFKKEEMK